MALVHAVPGKKIGLPPIGAMPADTKTSALVKTDRFEVVHLVLRARATIPSHSVPGFLTLQCLEGRIVLKWGNDVARMEAGDWIYLDRGQAHELSALEDSRLLLTIMFD
jgi:quercetin dioxygenase-like cupin family protein